MLEEAQADFFAILVVFISLKFMISGVQLYA